MGDESYTDEDIQEVLDALNYAAEQSMDMHLIFGYEAAHLTLSENIAKEWDW